MDPNRRLRPTEDIIQRNGVKVVCYDERDLFFHRWNAATVVLSVQWSRETEGRRERGWSIWLLSSSSCWWLSTRLLRRMVVSNRPEKSTSFQRLSWTLPWTLFPIIHRVFDSSCNDIVSDVCEELWTRIVHALHVQTRANPCKPAQTRAKPCIRALDHWQRSKCLSTRTIDVRMIRVL